jgi:hypothetical protein
MKNGISKEQALLNQFNAAVEKAEKEGAYVFGRIRRTITRFDGTEEETLVPNIVTKDGLNGIAELMLGDATGTNSGFRYLIIGTATAAGSLGSVQGGVGEVDRKIGATIASSNEVAILVATWAGNADSITGVALGTAAITNHANSGSGVFGSHVNSVDATLQASDFLKVQYEIQIGSHNL